jgi:hypothetical protein
LDKPRGVRRALALQEHESGRISHGSIEVASECRRGASKLAASFVRETGNVQSSQGVKVNQGISAIRGLDPSILTTGNREKTRDTATLGALSRLLSTLLDSRFKQDISRAAAMLPRWKFLWK